MRFIFIFFCLFFFLFACEQSKNLPENEIIRQDKMINIMEEVVVIETYYKSAPGNPAANKYALDSTVNLIFKKEGVTRTRFEKSYLNYSKNLPEFQKMQEEIMRRLEKKAL